MAKWTIIVLLACLFFTSMTTSEAAEDGIVLASYPESSLLYQSLKNEPSLLLVEQIIVLPKQPFDQAEAAKMIKRVDSLPDSLLEKINQHHITVKLFTGKLTDNPTAKALAGQVPRGYQSSTTWDDVPGLGGSQVVLVKIGSSNKGMGHGSINLELHELAHSVDQLVLHNISQTDEFKHVWAEEHEQLFPNNPYFLYPEEYFAESFAMYFLNSESREQLKAAAPDTFKFMEGIL